MKGYVQQNLNKIKHTTSARHQAVPSKIKRPNFGAKIQYVDINNNPTSPLTPSQIKHIQHSLRKFLHYSCAIEITMEHALNEISVKASNGTKTTNKAIKNFLDYALTEVTQGWYAYLTRTDQLHSSTTENKVWVGKHPLNKFILHSLFVPSRMGKPASEGSKDF